MKIAAVRTHTRSFTGKTRMSAVDYWRTIAPLRELANMTGWQVDEIDGESNPESSKLKNLKGYDLVWFSYLDNPVTLKALIDLKIRWSVDIDDDFLNMSPYNPVRQQYSPGSNSLKTIQWIIKNAPLLTVSTNHLARIYSKFRDPSLPPPFVLENRISPNFYKPRAYKQHSGTVFSWQGGLTHHADIFHTPFWGAMSFILGKYPDARLKIMGGIPDDFYQDMPGVSVHDGYADYQQFVNSLPDFYADVDVALCPLENNLFNDSKSSIKAQEALIFSVPVVAANVRPYQELASQVPGISLATTTRQWVEELERHICREKTAEPVKTTELIKHSISNYVLRYKQYVDAAVSDKPIVSEPRLSIKKDGPLDIVLSCTRFSDLTGVELYTYELARALKRLGHSVTIVSSCGGDLKERVKKFGVECISFDDIDTLSPDLIISSHFEPTSYLLQSFTCPIINVVHSENDALWAIERPVPGCDHYIAIRDTIVEKIAKQGIHPDKISVVMNPIDTKRFNRENTSSDGSILFIGPKDFLRKRVMRDLRKVAEEKGLSVRFVGKDQHEPPTWDTDVLTKGCEMVASVYLGRTAIEGWACGKAAIIYDIDSEGAVLSKYIVAPPEDASQFDSNVVAQKILKILM